MSNLYEKMYEKMKLTEMRESLLCHEFSSGGNTKDELRVRRLFLLELLTILLKTIIVYFLILVIFRIMGKREIGELSILDLVVFIMIAEMAAISIEDPNRSILFAIAPMILLMLLQIGLAYISLKFSAVRDVVDGKPSILIDKGRINEDEMRKQRYNFNDLLVQLREKHIKDIADVEFAILETSGKLSVFEKDEIAKEEQKVATSEGNLTNFPIPLIIDGKIHEHHLSKINRTNFWLRQKLKENGYKEIKKISYCSLDEAGNLYVDIMDEHK